MGLEKAKLIESSPGSHEGEVHPENVCGQVKAE